MRGATEAIQRFSIRKCHHAFRAAVVAAVIAVGAVALSGCDSTEPVCHGTAQTDVLLVSTGQSDLAVDRAMTPQVAREAVARAANSCGRLLVGLADGRPEADLTLQAMRFVPRERAAYNRTPEVTHMIANGTTFVQKHLLQPLKAATPSPGGAFLGALVAAGNELHVDGIRKANIIFVGNAIEDEPAPRGSETVDFSISGSSEASTRLTAGAASFEPLLRDLAGSCVMFIGAGANTSLTGGQILNDQSLLQETLAVAHVGFAATRSPDIPPTCEPEHGLSIEEKGHEVTGTLSSDLAFRLGSAQLQPSAVKVLMRLLPALGKAASISVSGYTDSTGTDAINGPLSRARARSVSRWIAARTGIPAAQIKIRGFGSADPVASNTSAKGRALNRRVVIKITTRSG